MAYFLTIQDRVIYLSIQNVICSQCRLYSRLILLSHTIQLKNKSLVAELLKCVYFVYYNCIDSSSTQNSCFILQHNPRHGPGNLCSFHQAVSHRICHRPNQVKMSIQSLGTGTVLLPQCGTCSAVSIIRTRFE